MFQPVFSYYSRTPGAGYLVGYFVHTLVGLKSKIKNLICVVSDEGLMAESSATPGACENDHMANRHAERFGGSETSDLLELTRLL